ncbi:sulfate ABC transporter substrate-binding protein [Segniliparus rugosus]|uniref:Sulfate ABC transporter, sulfate-binding protein n=1 Tax=Segniliparus rugosus (strain ATCC BAA-974 / DSM 45345 / CCUG 50838 / CIP 108380 / JCM 13579 / CDC 945) TaxID=679197 RepID=E5XM35_SEGRC|nr:sulfate ABC transporter substrate-binding protein [Segniliparus rugosus]EFV14596.1 sulfate ABC transporter, sulfate-binding protein [Segniliparus rugosus ATCC BAA-974]
MPPTPTLSRRTAIFGIGGLALAAAGCAGGSTDVPGGKDISSGRWHVNLVAYATPKPGFDAIIPAFRATPGGKGIGFSQSYGASGDQSRKVARRVPADVVNFSVEPDVTRLVKAGLVAKDWQNRPYRSIPFGSVVALVVRKGNPKGIHNWSDLLKPGVEVITPHPASSGSAKWNLLAPFAALSDGGEDRDAGAAYLRQLAKGHIKVNPKSGREATTTFQAGQGDVLISYENEAILLQRQNAKTDPSRQVEYLTPPVTFKIENPVALVSTSKSKEQANAFLDYLFSGQAQRIWAETGFRPVDPVVASETAGLFPGRISKLWTIDDLGGWKTADPDLFGPKGLITKAYQTR